MSLFPCQWYCNSMFFLVYFDFLPLNKNVLSFLVLLCQRTLALITIIPFWCFSDVLQTVIKSMMADLRWWLFGRHMTPSLYVMDPGSCYKSSRFSCHIFNTLHTPGVTELNFRSPLIYCLISVQWVTIIPFFFLRFPVIPLWFLRSSSGSNIMQRIFASYSKCLLQLFRILCLYEALI